MHSVTLRSHVGSDGILKFQVPVGLKDTDLEVMVIVQSLAPSEATTPEDRGWLPGFFEQPYSSIPDLERPSQGELPR
jgi:hypothetical protein